MMKFGWKTRTPFSSENDNDKTTYGTTALFVSVLDINHEDTSFMATITEFI